MNKKKENKNTIKMLIDVPIELKQRFKAAAQLDNGRTMQSAMVEAMDTYIRSVGVHQNVKEWLYEKY